MFKLTDFYDSLGKLCDVDDRVCLVRAVGQLSSC